MAAAALGLVLRFGPSVPRWDDFAIAAIPAGTERVTAGWLWSAHNEHRIVLPKLVLVGLLAPTGWDFRAGMVFNAAALAALAAALVVLARRRRGSARSTDAFFPLLLLHLGHHANLLWCFQVQFVLSTALALAWLLVVAERPGWPRGGGAALAGLVLVLLALCGANGAALVPALALWLVVASAAHAARGERRPALTSLLASVPALAVLAAYLGGYRAAGHQSGHAGLLPALRTAFQFLSLAGGPAAVRLDPFGGIAVVALMVATVGLLARVLVARSDERPRALGLLAFLGGLGSLALGLGWGRAAAGPLAGFEPRYVTLAAPLGCGCYLAWDLYGSPRLRRLVPLVLMAAMLVLLWPNTRAGLEAGRDLDAQAARLERDVRSGLPTYRVIRNASPFLHPSQDELTALLPGLRARGVGLFRALRPDPPLRAVALPATPAEVRLASWSPERKTARVVGVDPWLVYPLPRPRYVAGIRLRYAHSSPEGNPARFRLDWWKAGTPRSRNDPDAGYSNWNLPTGEGRTTTVWIGEPIGAFRIQPDNHPCEFRLDSLELLVPETAEDRELTRRTRSRGE
jgi:hypothetical protein